MGKTSNHEEQKRVEQEVFNAFCDVAGLTYQSGSFRQLSPPAPDIAVTIEGVGEVFFELTDISPASEIHRRNVLHQTPDAFIEHLNELPIETQRAFDAKYSNAIIFPSMGGLKGARDLRRHVPAVFHALMSLPEGFEGSVANAGVSLPPATLSLCVYRADHLRGPMFNAIGGSFLPRLNLDALLNKFSKSYVASGRLDLLAWIGDGGMFHEEDKVEIPKLIASGIASSPFDCVWVYEMASGFVRRFERGASGWPSSNSPAVASS
jgi:hypothetical protein